MVFQITVLACLICRYEKKKLVVIELVGLREVGQCDTNHITVLSVQ
jgi:hypothetical protein